MKPRRDLTSVVLLVTVALAATTPVALSGSPQHFRNLIGRRASPLRTTLSSRSQDDDTSGNVPQRLSFSEYIHRKRLKTWKDSSILASSILTVDQSGDEIGDSDIGGVGSVHEAEEELYKIVTEVNDIHLALTLVPAFTVLFGLFSAFIKEKLYAGEAIVAVVVGIVLGPYGGDVFDPRGWGNGTHFDEITLEFTRIVVALSVFAVGVELPRKYMLKHWRSLVMLLGPLMLAGWLISGGFILLFVPGLDLLQSLVVAAAVTPTDPILAASVVGKGKFAQEHVPAHLRHLLQAESGSNDGAAFPFLYLAMFLLLRGEHTIGEAIGEWILLVILYQIILGVVIGAFIGIVARKLLKFGKRKSTIDRESMVAMYVALALLTTGLTTLAGSDDLLAAFACGTAFAWDNWFTESIEESNFSNIIDLLINCTTFIYIGATIPFEAWNDNTLTLQPYKMVLLGLCILIFRRLPALLLFSRFVPDIKTTREAVFCGHFGPIGVGAVFISTLAVTKLPTPSVPPANSIDTLALVVQPLIYLLVLCSVLVHGLSIPFFSLGRNVHSRVHTMTRTWTQASGNEPSWLSRVKRVDRTADGVVVEKPGAGASPTATATGPDYADKLEKGELVAEPEPSPGSDAEASAGFPDLSERQRQLEAALLAGNDGEGSGAPSQASGSGGEQDAGNPDAAVNRPEPAAVRPAPASAAIEPPPPGQGKRPGVPFRLHTGLLRSDRDGLITEEERIEMAKRDAACRRERRDNLKRGETRTYVSGNTLIVEGEDGDVVEVRDKRKPGGPGVSIGVSVDADKLNKETAAVQREPAGLVGGKAKLEAARRLVARGLSWRGERPPGGSAGLPVSKRPALEEADAEGEERRVEERRAPEEEGPSDQTKAKAAHEAHYDGEGEQRWIEGHHLVIERNNGEDVEVRKLSDGELQEAQEHSAGAEAKRTVSPVRRKIQDAVREAGEAIEAEAGVFKGKRKAEPAAEPAADDDNWVEDEDGDDPDSGRGEGNSAGHNGDDDDEDGEDEDDSADADVVPTGRAERRPASPGSPLGSRRNAWRRRGPRAAGSSSSSAGNGSGNGSGGLLLSPGASSRASSPSRSIRFASDVAARGGRRHGRIKPRRRSALGFPLPKGQEKGSGDGGGGGGGQDDQGEAMG